jgi:Lrp/AsnC family transcriptional regulator, regulator for asnA, asnC and gidA
VVIALDDEMRQTHGRNVPGSRVARATRDRPSTRDDTGIAHAEPLEAPMGTPRQNDGRRPTTGNGPALAPGRRAIVREGATHALLDDVAKQIIEQLQQDGRRPYATIGKAVGLSEAAVRQRVQRLQDAGVMQIVAVTDPLQLGFPRQAMIGIRTTGDLEDIADRLADLDEVDYVVITAGSFDLLTEVVCRNDDHLLEILQRLRSVEGVVGTEAFVYLKLRKQTYSWGTA